MPMRATSGDDDIRRIIAEMHGEPSAESPGTPGSEIRLIVEELLSPRPLRRRGRKVTSGNQAIVKLPSPAPKGRVEDDPNGYGTKQRAGRIIQVESAGGSVIQQGKQL